MDALDQFSGGDRHRSRKSDERVDPRQAFAFLQLADLGPVQRGTFAELLLGEAGELPAAS